MMPNSAYFLLGLVLRFSTAEFCSPGDSIFDRGLEQVLLSKRFLQFPLPDTALNVSHLFGIGVSLAQGRLTGLRTLKRTGQSVLRVGPSGSRLIFHLKGGPFEAQYVGSLRWWSLRTSFLLGVGVPTFQVSYFADEYSPNRVQLHVSGIRMSRIHLRLGQINIGKYDWIDYLIRSSIQEKIGQILARVLRGLAAETLGAIQVYAAQSEGSDPVSPPKLPRSDDHDSQDDSEDLSYFRLRRRREPSSESGEREQWVFDRAISKLVVSTQFEPAALPEDLEDFRTTYGRVSLSEGNVTGLSSVYTIGESEVKLDKCGISGRLHLGFNDLIVSGVVSVTNHRSASAAFVLRIPAVGVVFEITERYNKLEIVGYEVDFVAPVTLSRTRLGEVGSLIKVVRGAPERQLESTELEQLKNATRQFFQKIFDKIADIIANPPVLRQF